MAERLPDKVGVQPELRRFFTQLGSVGIPVGTPVNAEQAETGIAEEVFNLMDDGDRILFDGVTYTYDTTPTAADDEFDDAATLAALIDAEDRWNGTEVSDDLEIQAALGGIVFNDIPAHIHILHDTTTGGGVSAPATASVSAAAIAELETGDVIGFAGEVFSYAETGADPTENEFGNVTGLVALLDDLADWDAVVNTGAADITSSADGAEWNDFEIVILYTRTTAGGVDGTQGAPGAVCVDDSSIYVTWAGNTVNQANWRKVDHEAL